MLRPYRNINPSIRERWLESFPMVDEEGIQGVGRLTD